MLRLVQFSLAVPLLIALSLMGCAMPPFTQQTANKTINEKFSNEGAHNTSLQQYFNRWQGTPYKYGGLTKSGIDCSGFIYLAFRNVYGQELPRSTELQAKTGTPVSQKNLTIGDLVFFRTGFKQRHAGIYIGQGKFIHASSSRGVTTSQLNSNYWQKHYWKSRRVDLGNL
jgi:cell wall-associated NlpC family hydrolase